MIRQLSLAQYIAEAETKFGKDRLNWKFVCPACGHIASIADYKAAQAPEGAVGFSCIGRWNNLGKRGAFEDGKPGPCDYAGDWLICLNPVEILGHGRYFELAQVVR